MPAPEPGPNPEEGSAKFHQSSTISGRVLWHRVGRSDHHHRRESAPDPFHRQSITSLLLKRSGGASRFLHPKHLSATFSFSHTSCFSRLSFRARIAQIYVSAPIEGPLPRPLHDSPGVMHHEAQCDGGDGSRDMAGIQSDSPLCPQ